MQSSNTSSTDSTDLFAQKGVWNLMNITLCSKIPISEQIACQIEELINMNILKEDEKLPSVRELAIEINVNPNTVSKAFKLLEDKKINYLKA